MSSVLEISAVSVIRRVKTRESNQTVSGPLPLGQFAPEHLFSGQFLHRRLSTPSVTYLRRHLPGGDYWGG